MESILAVFVGLIMIWIGFKMVKLMFKLILWGIALLLILGAIGYYYQSIPESAQPNRQKERREEHPDKRRSSNVKQVLELGITQTEVNDPGLNITERSDLHRLYDVGIDRFTT